MFIINVIGISIIIKKRQLSYLETEAQLVYFLLCQHSQQSVVELGDARALFLCKKPEQ